MIEIDNVLTELETFSIDERMEYISEAYPRLYVLILKHLEMYNKIQEYMKKCKTYFNDAEKYSLYVHGYWLVWLDQQRK